MRIAKYIDRTGAFAVKTTTKVPVPFVVVWGG